MKAQSIIESSLFFIFLLFFIFSFQNIVKFEKNIEYLRIDDLYSSIISLDILRYIRYDKIEEAYDILKKEFDICLIYDNKTLGDCAEKEKGIFYIVWDPSLNKTVKMIVYTR